MELLRLLFISVFLFNFLCIPRSLLAAELVNLAHTSFAQLQHRIPMSFYNHSIQFSAKSSQDFLLMDRHYDVHNTEHIRMQQRYKGFPVFGGYAVLHRKPGLGSVTQVAMNGSIYDKLEQDLGDCPPALKDKAAEQLERVSRKFPQNQIINRTVQVIVYVDGSRKAQWAYQIQVYLQPDLGLPSQPTMIISANTGKTLMQWDALMTSQPNVYGLGFGGNQRVGKYQYGKDLPSLNLLRDQSSGMCFLENDHLMVVDMKHGTVRPNYPMHFLCEETKPDRQYWTGSAGDGYDPINGSYSVSNDAMYFGELIKKMYRDHYGVEVLKKGQQPMQMVFRVHFSKYFANAFWDGQQMTFGDGDEMFHPLVALSITAHELSHGFTQQHSGLLYQGQAGGINEAFSDMASQAAEYYVYGKPSWQVGADVLKNQGALRWFNHPSKDGVSIERAIDFQVGMDVHYSSGVYNYLYYLLATHANWDPRKAFQVMIKANMDYWTPTTTFAEGSCGILAAARDLGYSEEDVMDALDDVVIDYGDCEATQI